ncbi:hypothetical protein R3W88_012597 [Solanum pinnatisectum]|uniref:Retrotransposon Copia-like N-terminal domain-containing protein n=1 Tax=Solanum pinnatisectum TaxID=50273 RepID=A0AAV9L9Q5_9SOLN|nr:hypothetical protein R3W88_012597 [Solanum pinnatisectum]
MAKKIDHDHPLYLTSSDLVGMENYTLWSRAMQLNLPTKNKLGCNAMVISWIMINVSKELVSGILFLSSAALVWSDLQERFDKDLWDEFDSIVPLSSCECTRSKDYIDSMIRQKLLQFLMELNDNYSQAHNQILMMNPPLSVNQCYAMIVQDETQRALGGEIHGGSEDNDYTALLISRHGGSRFGGSKEVEDMEIFRSSKEEVILIATIVI